jgi:hypothetical protein
LLLGQVTEKEEKAHPSHFLNFLLTSRTNNKEDIKSLENMIN